MEKIYAHRNKIVVILGVLLLSGLILLPSLFKGAPKDPLYKGPIEKIAVGNIGEFSIFNLIAKENGYFAENGLDATIHEYNAGPAAVAGLLAGEVDVTVAAEFVGVRNI